MGEDSAEIGDLNNQQHKVERKPVALSFSRADKVSTFTTIMRHPDAPVDFNRKVVSQLQRWHLLEDVDDEVYSDYEKFRKLMWSAKDKAQAIDETDGEYIRAFAKEPWNFDRSIEGEYKDEELARFPRAEELKSLLGDETRFLFRAEPGQFYLRLLVREDGRRQVLRTVDTERSVDQINADAEKIPDVIPPFETVRFSDGMTGLLIDWIDGELPLGEEEKALCLTHAEELLAVPMDGYDLWAGNFVVVDQPDGGKKPYYIDSDVIETIAEKGLQSNTGDDRKPLFEAGKTKMK